MTPQAGAGVLQLLRPKLRIRMNRMASGERRAFRTFLLGFVGLFFWTLIFAVIYRMLLYFRDSGLGDLLPAKLLSAAFLIFLSILLLSNIIAALSTFFLSEDLELLIAAPVESVKIYGARLTETIIDSSWMVALLSVPLLAAYGVVYSAGPTFYLLAVAVLIPLLVIPAVMGSAFTLILVNVFPARRTRDLLALIGLFAAAGLVALFRFLRPERLVRPEEFRDLVDFVAALRTPSSVWLPNEWAADTLMSHLNGFVDWHPFLLLLSSAAAAVVLGSWLHARFHAIGFSRAQEGSERQEGRTRSRWLDLFFRRASPSTRELVEKEIRVFFRDATQWSQLILLGVLVVVYVYNIQQLPLYTGEQVSFFLINVISFLNLGLAGFVVAAIAARFVFPAMSIEGRMMWLLRSSPLDVRRLFWAKYWVGTIPLLLVALPLIMVTNYLMEAEPLIFWLTTGTMIGATFALTAMALGFGALYPNYDTENVAEIPTSFGGLLFMMTAVIYLGVVVLLEAWPVYLFLQARLQGVEGMSALPMILGVSGAALVTVVAIVVPIRAGVRRVRSVDF